jgi:hypothetical protein
MEKQPENPTPVVSHEESDAQELRPWHRPVLERLNISFVSNGIQTPHLQ